MSATSMAGPLSTTRASACTPALSRSVPRCSVSDAVSGSRMASRPCGSGAAIVASVSTFELCDFNLRPSNPTPFVFVGNNEYQLSGLELGGRKSSPRAASCVHGARHEPGGCGAPIVAAVFGDVRSLDGFESFTAHRCTLDSGVARLQASIDGEVVTLTIRWRFASGRAPCE